MSGSRSVAAVLAMAFLAQAPVAALAFGRGGGGDFRGGSMGRPSGGFDLRNDVQPRPVQRPAQPPARPNPPQHMNGGNPPHVTNNNNNGNRGGNNNNNRNNNNNNNNRNANINNNTYNRNVVINNPVYVNSSPWGWNGGWAWAPAPYYWGGGFWGAMAIGVTSAAVSAAVYGSIVTSSHQTITSYQVQPNSPGATMLSNYQLTQTQCGPPNLVVIYGPSNSVICAYPNNLVSAGYYNLDTSTLSLTSTTAM